MKLVVHHFVLINMVNLVIRCSGVICNVFWDLVLLMNIYYSFHSMFAWEISQFGTSFIQGAIQLKCLASWMCSRMIYTLQDSTLQLQLIIWALKKLGFWRSPWCSRGRYILYHILLLTWKVSNFSCHSTLTFCPKWKLSILCLDDLHIFEVFFDTHMRRLLLNLQLLHYRILLV